MGDKGQAGEVAYVYVSTELSGLSRTIVLLCNFCENATAPGPHACSKDCIDVDAETSVYLLKHVSIVTGSTCQKAVELCTEDLAMYAQFGIAEQGAGSGKGHATFM